MPFLKKVVKGGFFVFGNQARFTRTFVFGRWRSHGVRICEVLMVVVFARGASEKLQSAE
jgi:hypothetical protein